MKTLKQLRAELATLKARAAEKLAELKDGIAADAARAIEDDHKKILDEIRIVTEQIEKREAELEEAETRASHPAHTPPATGPPAVQPQPASADVRAADILALGTQARMPQLEIESAIRNGETLGDFRVRAFEHLARASASTPTDPARVIRDEQDTRRAAMTEALAYGFGAPVPQAGPSEAARQYMGQGMVDMAATLVDYRGGRILNMRQIDQIYERASHTTSDFPIIMEGAINRVLESRYAMAEPTYRNLARRRDFRDFRPHTTVKLGDFPMLKPVLEDGEIKFGTFSEGKETISVASYAIGLRVTRQMLINDDLGAISELLSSYGSTVALFEEITFYLNAFNGTLADGNPVFHASHGNLAAAGTAITVDAVGKGRAAMKKQKTLEGNPLMTNKASFMLVGPDKEVEAEQLLATITPATVANVNIFSGRLGLMDTMQITGLDWYLFADPANAANICNYRWGYLDGYTAPRVRTDEPFGMQGFAMTVEHDFGCGAVDYRGGYKNPGA